MFVKVCAAKLLTPLVELRYRHHPVLKTHGLEVLHVHRHILVRCLHDSTPLQPANHRKDFGPEIFEPVFKSGYFYIIFLH